MFCSYYFFILFLLFHSSFCSAIYSITRSEPLFQNETLVSSNQIFELGFFIPNGSSNQYVGVWYKNMTPSRVLWVANRNNPISSTDTLASLTIGSRGNLRLVDGQDNVVWSTNVSVQTNDSVAVLLENGNFVLRPTDEVNSGSSSSTIWESFNYPCDTLLPGMRLGINSKTGEKWYLVSWMTETDPSPGNFTLGITSDVPTQCFGWNGSIPYWRTGQWDKSRFIGVPTMDDSYMNGYTVNQDTDDGTTFYYMYNHDSSTFGYTLISSGGSLKYISWNDGEWITRWEAPKVCERYGTCGPFGVCNSLNSPVCRCLKGFTPKSSQEWERGNWTQGCIRLTELNCSRNGTRKDVFRRMSQLKLPDFSDYLSAINNIGGCRLWCTNNCSCLAYTYISTIGCLVWSKDLIDIQEFSESGSGKDLYVRVADIKTGDSRLILGCTSVSIIIVIVVGIVAYNLHRKRANRRELNRLHGKAGRERLEKEDSSELPIFNFNSILVATNNFGITNKLGQGGYGPVYKGKLQDGTEVAVKRLSTSSTQGMEEFKTEITLVSKLQHRNLVRLLGCCVDGDEKIIIYEYLENKSLDTFLFNPKRKAELDWNRRFQIIKGVARGLLYLHHDSHLRVIHRDLKASNILLDQNLNPKISDFGLARIYECTQDLGNTQRVVGTRGYMSPEYAIGGIFSEKSDVYSFGVLLLEIISSKRNTCSYEFKEQYLSIASYAWQLWSEGKGLELLDEELAGSCCDDDVMRCIQIGLLCVQEHAAERPNMSTVVLMLTVESDLPRPRAPAFGFSGPLDHETLPPQESMYRETNSLIEGR